jgi:OOP family OmpA-OmpF porin
VIDGHTDNVGSDAYNLDLSQRRAEAVRAFLVQNGIRGTRVTAQGQGESSPVASNTTEAGRQQNRRVEIVVLR